MQQLTKKKKKMGKTRQPSFIEYWTRIEYTHMNSERDDRDRDKVR